MCASITTTNDEIMSTSFQAQEYFPFDSDSIGVFCCKNAVFGFTPLTSHPLHPLNDFISDITCHGIPQPKLSHIGHLPMNVDASVLPTPTATIHNAARTPPNEHEKDVAKRCIVLVEYYPQAQEQENRIVLPTLVTGGPVYGRVGQRVWIGRAYKIASADKDTQEEVDMGVFKADNGDMGAGGAAECMRTTGNEKQKWIWDWQPATGNEVVEATRAIIGPIDLCSDSPWDTPFGVERQAWECTKCSEDQPGVGQKPRKKWTFVLHWKRMKSEQACVLKGRGGKVKMESTKEGGLKTARRVYCWDEDGSSSNWRFL